MSRHSWKLLGTVDLVNKRVNPELRVMGVLLCMFDTRASLPKEVKADIAAFLENSRGTDCAWSQAQILPVHIRRNIKLAEAPSYGKTIFEYAEDCNGAIDYNLVAQYIHSGYREGGEKAQEGAGGSLQAGEAEQASKQFLSDQLDGILEQ